MLVCILVKHKKHCTNMTETSTIVLPAKTRLKISLAVTLVAAGGIYLSNRLEEVIPAPEEDKAHLPGHSRTEQPS